MMKRILGSIILVVFLFALSGAAFADNLNLTYEERYRLAFPAVGYIFTKTARIESAAGKTILKLKENDEVTLLGMHNKYFFAELPDGTSAFLLCDSVMVKFDVEIYGTAKKNIHFYSQPIAKKAYDLGVMDKGDTVPIRMRVGKWYVSEYEGVAIFTLAKDVSTY